MYQSFFGLTQAPLGKECLQLWDSGQLAGLAQQFNSAAKPPPMAV